MWLGCPAAAEMQRRTATKEGPGYPGPGCCGENGHMRASGLRRLDLREHQLTVLHRNALARVMVHLHRAFDIAQAIAHVVTGLLLVRVVNRLAALLGRRRGVALLHPILDAVAGVTTRCGACHRRDLAPVA